MAATESRTGFRLPWSSEDKANGQRSDEPQDADRSDDADASVSPAADGSPAANAESTTETPVADAAAADSTSADASAALEPSAPESSTEAGTNEGASVQPNVTSASVPRATDQAPKKQTKFLADLTRAMQAAAEASRAATLEQFQAEAKTHIEAVHARSADDATELRKQTDDDIVTIREWSKAELARIREETDRKITKRKADLDIELEEHAAQIESKIERVQSRVATFETEMDRFFERLLTEDDPAEFASLAENLPEPPPFDLDDDTDEPIARADVANAAPAEAVAESVADETPVETEATADTAATAEAGTAEADLANETIGEADGETYAVQDDPAAVEAAMRAIEAAYKAAESAPDGATESNSASDGDAATESAPADAEDPRLAALGLTPDLGAAEAEAAADAAATSDDEIPTIGDDALAARLDGLVPEQGSQAPTPRAAAPKAAASSQVVVTGLISVASIASFKRHLGRVSGVQSVGVSSGPDGEFVFKVAHGAEVNLADAIPTLPGFEARVTGTGDGVVNVSARDPESEG